MTEDERILQMIPAEGWFAVFADADDENDNRLEPLVCFALVEGANEGSRRVRPMAWADESVGFCDSVPGFAGVVRSDEVASGDEEEEE